MVASTIWNIWKAGLRHMPSQRYTIEQLIASLARDATKANYLAVLF